MRKRAQIKSKPTYVEPKHLGIKKTPKPEKSRISIGKNWWTIIILIGIFFAVLFYNTYFNASSEIAIQEDSDGYAKYLLSGPDPYYNMRIVQETHKTGVYQFYSENDPLLNYPLTAGGGRAPLLNMGALAFSNFLKPFMNEVDAIGYSMQFIPALFGALVIIPVYFLGKTLFNKKAGLMAAFFIAIMPIHIGSGHGSAFSLFDHDSLNLLLFFLTFLFIILSLREKDNIKSILYAVLAGVSLAGLSMVWVQAQFLYVLIAGYAIIQYIIDIFTSRIDAITFKATAITLLVGYLISLPVLATKAGSNIFDIPFFMAVGVIGFGVLYYFFGNKKIPWTLSLPFIFIASGLALAITYLVSISRSTIPVISSIGRLGNILFGTGIYGKKVSLTIAEANTYGISNTVMGFGPALYWLGWAGFVFLLWYYYKDKMRRDYLFIIVIFILDLYLASTAGRFLNDMVPLIAILGGWITWYIIDKIDYKQMIRSIRSAGGGFHGIRRGMKLMHIFGILILAMVVILPNAYVAMDAAVPPKTYQKDDGNWTNFKWDLLGEDHTQAYGLSLYKEQYWSEALNWLSKQDADIPNAADRPAFISWWDYGFYEVALGGHPTVADNFQDGIPPAANFHTATSEKEAVAVWIVRLIQGNRRDNGGLSDEVKQALIKYLGTEKGNEVASWFEDPSNAPSNGEPIDEELNKYTDSDEIDTSNLVVGAQWDMNPVYHDFVSLVENGTLGDNKTGLTEEEIINFYHDIQDATGYSIRYYGVEGYDKVIFNIFSFLSDKSLVYLYGAPEDDFVEMFYDGVEFNPSGGIKSYIQDESLKSYLELPDSEKRYIYVQKTRTDYKPAYFDTMFYRTYVGITETDENNEITEAGGQLPCYRMKHFYGEFISQEYGYPGTGKIPVIIAKYYEGAFINGSVWFNGSKIDSKIIVLKNLTNTPVEHDSFDYTASGENANEQFSVIAGAGSYIQVYKNIGEEIFLLKNIAFNGPEGSEYEPISDEDAMRQPDSNYERILNINITPGSLTGIVFNDIDDDGSYNESIDEPLEDINIEIFEVEGISESSISAWGKEINLKTSEDGSYSTSNLEPGYYRIKALNDEGYTIQIQDMIIAEGENNLDIINPELGDIKGIVYYDEDQDGEYTTGEEQDDVELELDYYVYNQEGNLEDIIETAKFTTTDGGQYNFNDLVPSDYYVLQASKAPDYTYAGQITISSNITTDENISLELVPVKVEGQALYNGQTVEEVEIEFKEDKSVDKNTADDMAVTTDENGEYSADLQPGYYNITVTKTEGTTLVYTFDDTIVLSKGQDDTTKNFELVKKSVNLSGVTSSDGTIIENVTIDFNDGTSVKSNINGEYSLEIAPGNYTIEATGEEFTELEIDYVYSWTGSLVISESEIATGKTFNIDKLEKTVD